MKKRTAKITTPKKSTNHLLHLFAFIVLLLIAGPLAILYLVVWWLASAETHRYNRKHPDQTIEFDE